MPVALPLPSYTGSLVEARALKRPATYRTAPIPANPGFGKCPSTCGKAYRVKLNSCFINIRL